MTKSRLLTLLLAAMLVLFPVYNANAAAKDSAGTAFSFCLEDDEVFESDESVTSPKTGDFSYANIKILTILSAVAGIFLFLSIIGLRKANAHNRM